MAIFLFLFICSVSYGATKYNPWTGKLDWTASTNEITDATGWTRTGASVVLTNSGDNVGIGTTDTATHKLTVSGSLYSNSITTGQATITSGTDAFTLTAGGLDGSGDLNGYNISYGTVPFISLVQFFGNYLYLPVLTSNGFITTSGGTGLLGIDPNLYSVGSYIGVGTTSPMHTLQVSGDIDFHSPSGVQGLYQDMNGNVGIGSMTPAYKLDVSESSYFRGLVNAVEILVDNVYINGTDVTSVVSNLNVYAQGGNLNLGATAADAIVINGTNVSIADPVLITSAAPQLTLGAQSTITGTMVFQDSQSAYQKTLNIAKQTNSAKVSIPDSAAVDKNMVIGSAFTKNGVVTSDDATGLVSSYGDVTRDAAGSITHGVAGTDGAVKIFSEQGVTDYTAAILANTAMTSAANFYLPTDEPAATSLMTMTAGGVMTNTNTSAGFFGAITGETGTGVAVGNSSPTFVGTVGIGSTRAATELNVVGDFRVGSTGGITSLWVPNDTQSKIGIGTSVLIANDVIKAVTAYNGYLQFNLQNTSNGASASSDVVMTADNGDEANNFVNVGINSSGFSGTTGGIDDAYLYTTGNDLYIGIGTVKNTDIIFMTNNTNFDTGAKAIIKYDGKVGIGTTNPAVLFEVNGLGDIGFPYGSISDSTTQTFASTTTAYPITFDTNEALSNITHSTSVNPSRITVDKAGTYLITYSVVWSAGAPNAHVSIWLRVNGSDVPRTNTVIETPLSGESMMTVTYLYTFTAGQYFELVANSQDTANTQILATAAGTTPTTPASPSIILTINKISR